MNDFPHLNEHAYSLKQTSLDSVLEKYVRRAHISTLHFWRARRSLGACRAAVYGALTPASQFVPDHSPDNN